MNRKQRVNKHYIRVKAYGPPYVVLTVMHRLYLIDIAIWLARRWVELPLDSRRFKAAVSYIENPDMEPIVPSTISPGQLAITERYRREAEVNRTVRAAIRRDDEAAAASRTFVLGDPWSVAPKSDPNTTPSQDGEYDWSDDHGQEGPTFPHGDRLLIDSKPVPGGFDTRGVPFIDPDGAIFPCMNGCGRRIHDEDELCSACDEILFAQFHPESPQHKCPLCPNKVEIQGALCDGCDDHVNDTVVLGKKPDLS